MGLTILAYSILGFSGIWIKTRRERVNKAPSWLKSFHFAMGVIMILLVLLLLIIGVVGTLGHYGNLGHSQHLIAGLWVVILVFIAGGSATQIKGNNWARKVHVSTNLILFFALIFVSLTGWDVVQKYL
jgi:nitrate reductase gamma subunit